MVSNDMFQNVLANHQNVFEKRSGTSQRIQCKNTCQARGCTKIYESSPVAYAMKEKIEKELDRLTSLGILSLIQFSE